MTTGALLIYILIATLSVFNFVRIFTMLIGSDIYDIRHIRAQHKAKSKRSFTPLITVIIPAYNEEMGVIRTLRSVMENDYKNKQIIVVNDGSTDKTRAIIKNFQRKFPDTFTLVNQENGGKAAGINRAVRYWAKGSLVMVLDADSIISQDGLRKMVAHFRDRNVMAAASNVKVLKSRSVLGMTQKFEYLISYRMKRALSYLNMEYIVGGVGSTFRRSVLVKNGYFDTDTITEDIDTTVKLIHNHGNKKWKIHYAADVVTYTEHVLTIRSLIKQRLRWKFGRFQTFVKHRELFFNRSGKYDKRLTWYQLPYALFGEFVLLLEPLLVAFIIVVSILYGDLTSLISVYLIVTGYVLLILIGENTESFSSKLGMSIGLPFIYFLLYILSAVEFVALMRSIGRSRILFGSQELESTWEHVERTGGA